MKQVVSAAGVITTAPEDGAKGDRGMLPYPAGEYSLTETYICTDTIAPYVLYDSVYYVMNKITSWVGQGMPSNLNNPQKDYAVNGTKATWIPFENYKAIYVELLMAQFAKLASAVFYGDYMFSQQGVDASGNSTEDYRKFGTNAFTPNLMLNFKTGDCELSGSIRRGLVVIDSEAPHQGITKNNIYVCKSDSNTLITLFFSPGSRSFGTEFSIINGGSGVVSIGYITDLAFLFKGKQYSIVKLKKPGDIAEFIYSPMTHSAAPDMGAALVIKNKSDFKTSSDGITLESI